MNVLKYSQTPIVTALIKEFPKETTQSIPAFLSHPETTWRKMKKLEEVLKRNNATTHALFERIIHTEFLQQYFDVTELSFFYRGSVHAVTALAMAKEVYWGLSQKKTPGFPEALLPVLHDLHRWCSQQVTFEAIKQEVLSSFHQTRELSGFLAKLELFMFLKSGGFNGRARYQTIAFIVSTLKDPGSIITARQLAIRTMGSALQLRWCSVQYTHSDFNTFLDALEQAFLEINGLPVTTSSEMRSLLLNKCNKLFEGEFPPF